MKDDLIDVLDCQEAEAIQSAIVEHLKQRADQSEAIAKELRKTAADALSQAASHEREVANFRQLAGAIERAPVAFYDPP